MIKVEVTDLHGNVVNDTSDGTFAIDPPPSIEPPIDPDPPGLDKTPPTLAHIPPIKATSGEPLTLTLRISDDIQVSSAILYYRVDEGDYRTRDLTHAGGAEYYTNLLLDEPGLLEYYVKASDGVNVVKSDEYEIEVTEQQVPVQNTQNVGPNNNISLHPALLVLIVFIMALSLILNVTSRFKKPPKKKVKKRVKIKRKVK